MREPAFRIDADRLHDNRAADTRLCFRNTGTNVVITSTSRIRNSKSLGLFSVCAGPGRIPEDRFGV